LPWRRISDAYHVRLLSPVHTSNNVEPTLSNATSRTILSTKSNVASTKSNVASALLPLWQQSRTGFSLNFVLAIKPKQIEHVQFVSALSKERNLTKTRVHIVANGNNVDTTFDFVERIVRLVVFDNVVSTLLLVWTRLYSQSSLARMTGCALGVMAALCRDNRPMLIDAITVDVALPQASWVDPV